MEPRRRWEKLRFQEWLLDSSNHLWHSVFEDAPSKLFCYWGSNMGHLGLWTLGEGISDTSLTRELDTLAGQKELTVWTQLQVATFQWGWEPKRPWGWVLRTKVESFLPERIRGMWIAAGRDAIWVKVSQADGLQLGYWKLYLSRYIDVWQRSFPDSVSFPAVCFF